MLSKQIVILTYLTGVALLASNCRTSASAITTTSPTEAIPVMVFFSEDVQANCAAVTPVERLVSPSPDIATAALEQLFAGPTDAEKAQGYSSWFSTETANSLLSLRIDGDNAYINLEDIRSVISSANSSCGSQMFFAQIETTLKNVAPVERALYAIEGDPVAFYEWMQLGCDPAINNCDPNPFTVP